MDKIKIEDIQSYKNNFRDVVCIDDITYDINKMPKNVKLITNIIDINEEKKMSKLDNNAKNVFMKEFMKEFIPDVKDMTTVPVSFGFNKQKSFLLSTISKKDVSDMIILSYESDKCYTLVFTDKTDPNKKSILVVPNNSLLVIKDIIKSNYKFGIYVGIDDNYINEKDSIQLKANKVNCLLAYN